VQVKQFSKYGGVAAGSALTDYAVFTLLLFLGTGVLPAQIVSRISGGVFSFAVNKYWSFGAKEGHLKREGRRFLILYGFSYLLALLIVYVLTVDFGINPYPAKLAADTTCFVVNFLVMRHYVFDSRGGILHGLKRLFRRG
jgi:putative flippase GtrA